MFSNNTRKIMKFFQLLKRLFYIFCFIYVVVCAGLYFWQEKLIFLPEKLDANHEFSFKFTKFDEINLPTNDGESLNGLHFHAKEPKGAILFLHGNAGSINGWGIYGEFFVNLGYDFFVFDYRSFGKSSGKITSENELFIDTDLMFEHVLSKFKKDEITILGYSIGSGLSARIADKFGPKRLILVSAYYNFKDLASSKFPFVPTLLMKYQIPTDKFLADFTAKNPNSQVLLLHGKNDSLIEISNSQKLAKFLKQNDKFFQLNCGHNDIFSNLEFYKILENQLK